MAVTTTNLGVITAYGDAVAAGYTGTKAEWQALMASYATVGQQAVDAKNAAVAAKDTAVAKATEATTAAGTATTKANEASASAQSIAESAAQIQENTDSIDQLMSELTTVSDGNQDCMLHAVFYDGYYNGTPAYTGTKTEGVTSSWGVCVIPVPIGKQITLSGFRAQGGVNTCWLNSSDPADVKQAAWKSAYNNGTKTCVTGWLGLADYNLKGLSETPSAIFAVLDDIKNDIDSNNDMLGAFTDSRNLYSNNPNDWNYPAYNASQKFNIPVEPTERGLVIMHDKTTVPTSLANGTLNVRQYDASDNLLSTQYHSLLAVDREIRYISFDDDCAYLKIDFNTGNTSILVTADDIRQFKAYVGEPLFTSYTVFPKVDFPEKSIPKQSRTLMDGGYLPDYWIDYLSAKKDVIDDLTDIVGDHGFSFAFITDQHWPTNYQKSPKIMKWLKDHTTVNRFVSGGDIINEHKSVGNAMKYVRDWRDSTNGLMIRNLRGNHDNNSMQNNSSYYLGDGRFYSNLIAPIENEVPVVNGNLYYYEKIEAQKVCIFYLDTGDIVTPSLVDFDAQISWMSGITATLDSDWSILVIQHIVYDGGTQESPTVYTMGQKTIDFLNSVTNCNVIGVIAGHTHYDYSDTSNGYPIIITSTDSAQRAQTLPATAGTTSEQLFDVFHVDTENRKIYATRIGAGTDREWSY